MSFFKVQDLEPVSKGVVTAAPQPLFPCQKALWDQVNQDTRGVGSNTTVLFHSMEASRPPRTAANDAVLARPSSIDLPTRKRA